MAVQPTQSYLLDLSQTDSNKVFDKLISSKVPMELLNPIELGGEWVEVEMEYTTASVSKNIENRAIISAALENNAKKGFFSFLIDDRDKLESTHLNEISSKKTELLEKAGQLKHLNTLKSELDFAKKLKVKSNQQIWVGKKHPSLQEMFDQFVEELKNEFLQAHPEEALALIEPKLQINSLEIHDIITITDDKQELFHEFIHQTKAEYLLITPFIQQTESGITEMEMKLGYSNNFPPSKLILDLKSMYSVMELEDNYFHFQSHIFSPVPNSSAKFVFLNIPSNKISAFEKVLNNSNLTYQQIEWNEEIVNWKNTSGLTPFQNIAQSMGTISKNEVDPSTFISFFFILFFAIALNDALYGLIICLFTGYFIYFTRLKQNWKNMFNLFFLAGIGSIGWGALSNSWAGNLFLKTPLNSFLEMFQIINPLELESKSPINQILIANGGISPIVVLLGFAVVVGLVQITSGYYLKIVNALKKDDTVEALSEVSWLLFIFSGITWLALNILNPSFSIIAMVLTFVGIIGMYLFNHGHGIGGKLLSGSIKLYELIAFFADMLSYTRLIAIGLTGAIIAEVVNILANLVSSSTGPVIGFILGAVVLVIGHSFNMVVGLFGAYINPLRLHYVEFLPKFFQGKARPFKPLQIELKYVLLT